MWCRPASCPARRRADGHRRGRSRAAVTACATAAGRHSPIKQTITQRDETPARHVPYRRIFARADCIECPVVCAQILLLWRAGAPPIVTAWPDCGTAGHGRVAAPAAPRGEQLFRPPRYTSSHQVRARSARSQRCRVPQQIRLSQGLPASLPWTIPLLAMTAVAARLAALDHPEWPGPPFSALPGLRVAGVRAGRQDRPAAQGLAEDVVILPWDGTCDVRLHGPGGPAADQFGVVPDERRG